MTSYQMRALEDSRDLLRAALEEVLSHLSLALAEHSATRKASAIMDAYDAARAALNATD